LVKLTRTPACPRSRSCSGRPCRSSRGP
jgi:hypothetical protein